MRKAEHEPASDFRQAKCEAPLPPPHLANAEGNEQGELGREADPQVSSPERPV